MKKSIGLIGCGAWGKNILRDLLALQAEVFVVSRSEKTNKEVMQQGVSNVYTNVEDIADCVDGFVVATPTTTHADVLEQLLPYNKPIFVEKPLTSDIHRAHQLQQEGKGKIFLMDKWRYHAGVDALAQYAKKSMLGDVELIRTYRLGWGNPHPDVDALWILLPHDLSIVLHILGYIPSLHSVVPLLRSDPSAGVIVTLKDKDSPTVIIEVSTVQPEKRRSLYVVGSEATMELVGSYDDELTIFRGKPAALDKEVDKIPIANTMPLYAELEGFIKYLNGGAPPLSSLEEGVRVVEVIHAVHECLGLAHKVLLPCQ